MQGYNSLVERTRLAVHKQSWLPRGKGLLLVLAELEYKI